LLPSVWVLQIAVASSSKVQPLVVYLCPIRLAAECNIYYILTRNLLHSRLCSLVAEVRHVPIDGRV